MSVSACTGASSCTGENTASVTTSAEGNLVKTFRSAINLTCEKFLASAKFSAFKKKYRVIYDVDPAALKNIFEEWKTQMEKSVLEDLDKLCKENIDFLLNSLEKTNKEQNAEVSWRPSGNPEEDLRDHIFSLKIKKKELLENALNELVIGNEELINIAAVNHADIMHLNKSNEELSQKMSSITSSLTGENLQNLQMNTSNLINDH